MRKDVNGDLEQNSIYLASSIIVAVSVRRWLNLPGKITQENHSGKFNSELKYCLLINESSSVLVERWQSELGNPPIQTALMYHTSCGPQQIPLTILGSLTHCRSDDEEPAEIVDR